MLIPTNTVIDLYKYLLMFWPLMRTPLPEIYRAFSDPTRLRILNLLLQQPLCVCHVQDVLDLPQVNTSQHLAYLRRAGIVEFERVQTWKVYRLKPAADQCLQLNLKCLADCVRLDPVCAADLSRLRKALGDRPPRFVKELRKDREKGNSLSGN
jgi:ArsR family transcriptional regulator, arsenate/arsenite/antimonite-responsive transcriptional repressor